MIQMGTNGVFRFGHVSEYDAKRHMAKIVFPAMDGIISGWLPVIVSCSNGNYSEAHIDIGTHVACLMAGEGVEAGIVMGAFYDDSNKPHEGNPDITRIEFSDGTCVSYNRDSHVLNVNCQGAVRVSAENITLDASNSISISAGGNVTVTGSNIYLN